MSFPVAERDLLLRVRGVGPVVIARLEQIGFHSLTAPAETDPAEINRMIASELGTTCWKNSPQARAAIAGAVRAAPHATAARD